MQVWDEDVDIIYFRRTLRSAKDELYPPWMKYPMRLRLI